MIEFDCPWCAEEALLPLPELQAPETSYTCVECGTTVTFIEEPFELDLAA